MRRGVRIPACYLLPAAGGGSGNPEQLPEPARPGAFCHPPPQRVDRGAGPGVAATAIGFRLSVLFRQVDVTAICSTIRDWTIAQIPGDAADLDQLMCDGKSLRGSIVPTAGGGSAYGLPPTASTLPKSRTTPPLWVWQ
jgi:hypothetical protein